MTKLADLVGAKFERWTVISRAPNSPAGQTKWLCRCDCGNEATVQGGALVHDHSRSCGCLKVETTISRSTKHHHSSSIRITPTYHSWAGMKARCSNPKNKYFDRYGGRGVSVCKRWREFKNFLNDMGEKPPGTSIDRYPDKDGNYTPSNCRWATWKEQARNKSSNRCLTLNGVTLTAAEWSERLSIPNGTISERLKNGRSDEEALSLVKLSSKLPR